MEHGRIISQGRHEELLEKSDVYRELYMCYSEKREAEDA